VAGLLARGSSPLSSGLPGVPHASDLNRQLGSRLQLRGQLRRRRQRARRTGFLLATEAQQRPQERITLGNSYCESRSWMQASRFCRALVRPEIGLLLHQCQVR